MTGSQPAISLTMLRPNRGLRLLAFLLDEALFGLPLLLFFAALPFSPVYPFQAKNLALAQAFGLAVMLYQIVLAREGRTFGRMLLGLELRTWAGTPCPWIRTALRDGLVLLFWIPFLADPLCRTRVAHVSRPLPRLSGWAGGVGFCLILIGASMVFWSLPKPPPPATLAWIREHAIPLVQDGGGGVMESAGLARTIGDAKVVGVGEATHGTRESSQLKVHLFETLVRGHGFNVFALEAPYPNALAVNEYVHGGAGDPAALVKGLGFWTVGNQEVLGLVRWMRSYNLAAGHDKQLSFQGFDVSDPADAYRSIRRSLLRIDPEQAPWLAEKLPDLQRLSNPGQEENPDRIQACREQAETLTARLASLSAGSRGCCNHDLEAIRQCGRVLVQSLKVRLAGPGQGGLRDSYLADNVQWLLTEHGPAAKVMVWAHNGHVALVSEGPGRWIPMGAHLRHRLGQAYRAYGFTINQGEYLARDQREIRVLELPKAQRGSLEHGLSLCGLPAFALVMPPEDPAPSPVAWFMKPLATREIGSVVVGPQALNYTSVVPTRAYDCLLFLDKTTKSRLVM